MPGPYVNFVNIDYTYESSLLEKLKKVRGANLKSSGEACVASTFYQRYPAFIVGYSTWDVESAHSYPDCQL